MRVSMKQFTEKILAEFPEDITQTAESPADDYLFQVREDDDPRKRILPNKRAQVFHRIVAMLLFLVSRSRRDCKTAVAFLTTRVTQPDEDDWGKLQRVL